MPTIIRVVVERGMPFGIGPGARTVEIFRHHNKRDEPVVFQPLNNVAGDAAAEPYLRFIEPGQQSTFVLEQCSS